MKNIEIKTPVDGFEAVKIALDQVGAAWQWDRRQRDVFFNVPRGYLKLRMVAGEPAELIAYQRASGSQPRPSDYDIASVQDGDSVETALTRSLGVRGVVDKVRSLYLWRHTRIHLDDVRGLGTYLELEAVARDISLSEAGGEAQTMIERLALDPRGFLDRPYLELQEALTAHP